MIITKTPFRVSFFGGGTDYPQWFQQHGGCFLSMAIDKYCYLSVRNLPPFFEHKHRLVYSIVENVSNSTEFKHPVVREVLGWKGCDGGLEIHHDGDLPARSGLGSSSSFTVGFLHALAGLKGQLSQKRKLADEAIFVEQNLLGETVGIQDQIAAAFGGINSVSISMDGEYSVNPVLASKDRIVEFESHLLLCFTGLSRFASEVAAKKVASFQEKETILLSMQSLVAEGERLLVNGCFQEFGEMLNHSWHLKRSISPAISSCEVNELYDTAIKYGAWGGKLLGAGGGGFMLLFVPPERQKALREKFQKSVFVPIQTDWSGSQVAFYQPSGL